MVLKLGDIGSTVLNSKFETKDTHNMSEETSAETSAMRSTSRFETKEIRGVMSPPIASLIAQNAPPYLRLG